MSDEMTQEGAPQVASDAPTGQLIREALDETRNLLRLELALAREEMKSELAHAKAGAIALGAAAAAAMAALTMFMVTIAMAFASKWLASLIIGGILLVTAGVCAFAGWKALPTKPMAETNQRLENDMKQFKERIA